MKTSKDFYLDRIDNGKGTEVDGWKDTDRAVQRYMYIAEMVTNAKTLLDVGCGTGALSIHLDRDIEYYGIDTMKEYISIARERHPDKVFDWANPTSLEDQYDVAVCLGTYNIDLNGTAELHIAQELKSLLECSKMVILTGFHRGTPEKDMRLYYFDINELYELAYHFGVSLTINNYLSPYEFTAIFSAK